MSTRSEMTVGVILSDYNVFLTVFFTSFHRLMMDSIIILKAISSSGHWRSSTMQSQRPERLNRWCIALRAMDHCHNCSRCNMLVVLVSILDSTHKNTSTQWQAQKEGNLFQINWAYHWFRPQQITSYQFQPTLNKGSAGSLLCIQLFKLPAHSCGQNNEKEIQILTVTL